MQITYLHVNKWVFQVLLLLLLLLLLFLMVDEETECFDPPDLFEERNANLVIYNIHRLARRLERTPTYSGPKMEEEDITKTRNLFSCKLHSLSRLHLLIFLQQHLLETLKPLKNLLLLLLLYLLHHLLRLQLNRISTRSRRS